MIKIPSRVFFLLEGQCFYSIFTSTCPSLQEYPLNLNSTSNFHCIQPQSHQKSTKSPWHHLAKSFKMIHQRHFHSSVWLSIKFSRYFQIYFIKNKKWSKQCSVYLTRKKKKLKRYESLQIAFIGRFVWIAVFLLMKKLTTLLRIGYD